MSDITILNRKEGEPDEKGIEARLKEDQIKDQAKKARDFFAQLQTELDEIEVDVKDGLSYLDMKNDTLLSYMIDLCNIILCKVRGESISGHASVDRCVTYRVILEKIKAIDQRLAYQLNKVISLPDNAKEEGVGINIENLDIDIDSNDDNNDDEAEAEESASGDSDGSESENSDISKDDDESGSDDDSVVGSEEDEGDQDDNDHEHKDKKRDNHGANTAELREKLYRKQVMAKAKERKSTKDVRATNSSPGIYKPPKLRSVAYDGDDNDHHGLGGGNRDRRRRDYSDFYQDDENQDIVDESTRAFRDNERVRYEEDNYTRLPDDNPKKAKRKLKIKAAGGKGKKFKGKRGGKR